MKADLINPFLIAARHVLAAETGEALVRADVRLEDSHFTTGDLTVIIGVMGRASGCVCFGFSERAAKRLASAMLGRTVVFFNRLAESALAELGNMIAGRASGALEQSGYSCVIGPPTLLIGRSLVAAPVLPRLCVTLRGTFGDLHVDFALREYPGNPAAGRSARLEGVAI